MRSAIYYAAAIAAGVCFAVAIAAPPQVRWTWAAGSAVAAILGMAIGPGRGRASNERNQETEA